MFRRAHEVVCTEDGDVVVLEGVSLEAVVCEMERRCGPDLSILSAERSIRGGLKGFFGHEWFRLVARAGDQTSPAVSDGGVTDRVDAPSFATALAEALAAHDSVEVSSIAGHPQPRPGVGAPPDAPTPSAAPDPDEPLPASRFLHQARPVHLALPELSLEALLDRLDTVEPGPPLPPGGAVAVIGKFEIAHHVAQELLSWTTAGTDTEPIVATLAPEPGYPAWLTATTTDQIRRRRPRWAARVPPTFVVVAAPGGSFRHHWVREVLTALDPVQVRCALPAWAGHEAAVHAIEDLGGVIDVIDLVGLAQDAEPSRFLELPYPIGSIDGRPASAGLWAAHLLAAPTPLHEAPTDTDPGVVSKVQAGSRSNDRVGR